MRDATTRTSRSLKKWLFLLTRPMRDATRCPIVYISLYIYFYSRAPCGTRQLISNRETGCFLYFYSRAPCGTRLSKEKRLRNEQKISTHAPHAGRDGFTVTSQWHPSDFYSRAPCGTRLISSTSANSEPNFYSRAPCGTRHDQVAASKYGHEFLLTRPMRDATMFLLKSNYGYTISTHAPHAGRDSVGFLPATV